jgi:fibronectin-binding autotransporter adhesin
MTFSPNSPFPSYKTHRLQPSVKSKSLLALCCSSSTRQSNLALAAAISALLGSASAQAGNTWDGGSTGPGDNSWATTSNWNPDGAATFGADQAIIIGGTTRLTSFIGAVRTLGSLSFDSTNIGDTTIRINALQATGSVGRTLTFDVTTGNAQLVVDAAATGSKTIETTGNSPTPGTISLLDNLDVVHNGSGNLNLGGANTVISGAGGIMKTGSGNLVLGLANANLLTGNTYTGGTTVTGGTVTAAAASALSQYNVATKVSVGAAGTLALNYGGASDWTSTQLTGLLGANGVNFAAGSKLSLSTANGSGAYADAITVANLSLIKTGANALTLSGNNSYTGTTTMTAGTLVADVANGIGTGALGNGGDIIFGGGTLQYTANSAASDYSARIKSSGSAIILDTNSQNVNLGSAIASTNIGGLTKIGLGTLTLGSANSYTGTTTISQGGISLASFDRLGTSSSDIVTGGVGNTSLTYTGTGETVTRNIAPTGNNLLTLTQSGATGTLNYAGNFLPGGTFNNRTLALDGTGTAIFSGVINNADATRNTTLAKNGTGTWSLTNANLYRGATNVNQGTLTVSGSGILGATTGGLNVSNTNTTAAGTDTVLNLSTTLDTTKGNLLGTIDTPLTGTNTATINNGGSGRNFTINQTAANSFAGVIAGGGDFTLGSGSNTTLTLTGTNTYTGNTSINGGTLAVDGSISTSLLTTVNSGGTLGGTGTVGATTVAAGGILAPGNSIGTLNFSDTLTLGGISNFEIDPLLGIGVNADRANVTNGISYGGILNVLYAGPNTNFASGMIFNLFDASSFADSFSAVNLPTLTGGLTWQNDLATNGSLTVIPEPNAAMLFGGLGMLALLRRRRA